MRGMLRAEDLGAFYQKVRLVEGERIFFLQRFNYALYFTISGKPGPLIRPTHY